MNSFMIFTLTKQIFGKAKLNNAKIVVESNIYIGIDAKIIEKCFALRKSLYYICYTRVQVHTKTLENIFLAKVFDEGLEGAR